MDAVRLYKKYSIEELQELDAKVRNDPKNQLVGQFYLYTPAARKKLHAIAQAITWHIADRRKEAGNPVIVAGYTGRKSNK